MGMADFIIMGGIFAMPINFNFIKSS